MAGKPSAGEKYKIYLMLEDKYKSTNFCDLRFLYKLYIKNIRFLPNVGKVEYEGMRNRRVEYRDLLTDEECMRLEYKYKEFFEVCNEDVQNYIHGDPEKLYKKLKIEYENAINNGADKEKLDELRTRMEMARMLLDYETKKDEVTNTLRGEVARRLENSRKVYFVTGKEVISGVVPYIKKVSQDVLIINAVCDGVNITRSLHVGDIVQEEETFNKTRWVLVSGEHLIARDGTLVVIIDGRC